jgi:hypothetical protein
METGPMETGPVETGPVETGTAGLRGSSASR